MHKYIHKLYLPLFILLFSSGLYSQKTTISGVAHNQPNMMIRLLVYADNFSNLERSIAETRTDLNGEFSIDFEISNTQFSYITLGLDRGELYISPGSSYKINIPYDTLRTKGSIFDRLPLRFSIDPNDNGIQNDIENYNIVYNDFLYKNATQIYRSRSKTVVKEFIEEVKNDFDKVEPSFVKQYIDYSLVSLIWLSKMENNSSILENYLINKPVLYDNIQYCEFFREFFKGYFDVQKTFRYEEIVDAINYGQSASALTDLITRDSLLLADRRITELNAMLLLSSYYYDRYVNKKKVREKLEEISMNSSYSDNKQIAENFITKLTQLDSGSKAPNFKLTNVSGKSFSLNDLKGRFVLLTFYRNDCRICEFHIDQLAKIQEATGVEVVVITAGKLADDSPLVTKISKLNWLILQTGSDITVLEDYEIKAFPTYILINPDSTIGYVHLPMPQENMQLYISRFMEVYNNNASIDQD